jgi:hypothetical protein
MFNVLKQSLPCLSKEALATLSLIVNGPHDTQHNDIWHNDIQNNDTQHKEFMSDTA